MESSRDEMVHSMTAGCLKSEMWIVCSLYFISGILVQQKVKAFTELFREGISVKMMATDANVVSAEHFKLRYHCVFQESGNFFNQCFQFSHTSVVKKLRVVFRLVVPIALSDGIFCTSLSTLSRKQREIS